jgi:glutamine cyclotransferase
MIKKTQEGQEINMVTILEEVQGKAKEWLWFKIQILVIMEESSKKKLIIDKIWFKEVI